MDPTEAPLPAATPGGAIRLIRERAGHTRAYMADVLGVTERRLSVIEAGADPPPPDLIAAVRVCWGYCPLLLVALSTVAAAERAAGRPAALESLTAHRELLGLGID